MIDGLEDSDINELVSIQELLRKDPSLLEQEVIVLCSVMMKRRKNYKTKTTDVIYHPKSKFSY